MANIVILGSGGWGTALAVMTAKSGHSVTLWSPFEEEIAELSQTREHKKLLPGIILPPEIALTTSLDMALGAELLILAVPSFAVRQTARRLRERLSDVTVIANVAKGLEEGRLIRLSEVIEEELPSARVVALSGPSHAEEVARGIPTSVVSSSRHGSAAELVQDTLMNPCFRIYTNPDIVGVELGGALKNVMALAAGVSDGLGLGDNTKAMLMTRGLSEMARLGVAMGARRETFAGLTGVGDLVVTCTSMHSRNRRFGIMVGEGVPPKEALERVGQTVEGYKATLAAHELAKRKGIEMPITECCHRVLYGGLSPRNGMYALMTRPKTHEVEEHPWF
ncbi:MAG: NAD(P)-dependent glycerol-3-phosphate dehydrogenase [Oscillospiraceae bacterium]|nr:NAD(P)-dependent glycerol-3-phosphate dehydrogenase [Oscillospiraceae bacterium]